MGTIRVHEFITLDGVIDTPSWTFDFGFDPKMGPVIGAVMGGCQAILLGRTTYEMFAPAWSTRTAEQDPGAPFMNDTPKYVVTSTLQNASWKNSSILGSYDADKIRRFKDEVDGGIYVSGSGTLVRALINDGLVDELHLFLFPVVQGSGPRLFPDKSAAGRWSLAAGETYNNGVVYLHYQPESSTPSA
jgi:dihydrofolate reductase